MTLSAQAIAEPNDFPVSISTATLGKMLNRDRRTITRLVSKKELIGTMIGNSLEFSWTNIVDYIGEELALKYWEQYQRKQKAEKNAN